MLKLGLILLIAPTLGLMGAFMLEQNQIRECVDQGNAWDYIAAICTQEGDTRFVPFMSRYPLLVNGGMFLSVLGLLLTIVGLYRPSKAQVGKG